MANEKQLLNDMQLAASQSRRSVLFRNNVGTGWVGRVVSQHWTLTLADFRPLRAGLCPGSSDLIGWTEVVVTPEMVGRTMAVFTAIEAKTPDVKVTHRQQKFIDRVKQAGGIASVAREVSDINSAIKDFEIATK